MHPTEVDSQIRSDYDKFVNAPYGKPIPENLLDYFEKALMIVPPQAHGVLFTKVKGIISKELTELTVSDINDIIKVTINVGLSVFHDSLFEAIPEQIKMEKFILKFNQHIQEFQVNLEQKKQRLQTLSGGVLGKNGMRIIPSNNQ